MNQEHGLTKENLLRALPISLSSDPNIVALARAIAEVLEQRRAEIDRVSIYPRISQLDEGLLDILARDFKVDWWDNDYSLEEKRRTLASSWQVHKTLGTKAAVEAAIQAVYPATQVMEWFEYGGEPYHFKLNINITDDDAGNGKQHRVLERLEYYKNLRSHLDGVTYFLQSKVHAYAGAVFLGSTGHTSGAAVVANADWPRVPVGLRAGGVYLGQYRRITAEIDGIDISWPSGQAEIGSGAGVLGIYQRMGANKKGGNENGTLE